MRRFSRFVLFGVSALTPFLAHAQAPLNINPIIPISGACTCVGSAPDWGCVLQTIQTLMNDAVGIAAIIITLYIAWAGIAYLTAPVSADARQKGRQRIVNAVLGLVIILAAWLLIDSIMKVIYNSSATASGLSSQLGPWNAILSANGTSYCIKPITTTLPLASPTSGSNANGGVITQPVTAPGAGAGTPSQNAIGNCTASALQPVFGNDAAAMSCVTHYEDGSCNLTAPSGTDKGADGNSVSFGMFQINISANNLSQYPACEAAVNNQPLNCEQAFSGGAYTGSNHNTTVSNSALYQTCISAVSNPACNEQAAQNILNTQGIGAWGSGAQNNCSSLLQ